MARTIDGTSYSYMDGVPAEPIQELRHKARPGVDGVETHLLGLRGPESPILTKQTYADASAAGIRKAIEAAMVGFTATIVDDFDDESECEITGVVHEPLRPILCPVGAGTDPSHTVELTTHWTVRKLV